MAAVMGNKRVEANRVRRAEPLPWRLYPVEPGAKIDRLNRQVQTNNWMERWGINDDQLPVCWAAFKGRGARSAIK